MAISFALASVISAASTSMAAGMDNNPIANAVPITAAILFI